MTTPSRPSRFGNLRALKERGDVPPIEERSSAPTETPAVPPQLPQDATKDLPAGKGRPRPAARRRGAERAEAEQPAGKVGRPTGKRSDETFRQVSALVRRDTYKATQRRLLEEEREFSELVQSLLDRWLRGDVTG